MKLEAVCIKDERKFRVMYDKEFREQLDSLRPGKYKMTVERYRKNKSNSQLGYLYACVYPLSLKLLNDAGWEVTNDDIDIFWKKRFAEKEIVNRNTGEIELIPDLKRNFTTTDMMAYIEAIRNFCSEYLDGYVPEPEEQTNFEFNEES